MNSYDLHTFILIMKTMTLQTKFTSLTDFFSSHDQGWPVLVSISAKVSCKTADARIKVKRLVHCWLKDDTKQIIRTINIDNVMELSVYITSFSAEIGFVSFNFDATNMQAAPSSCNLVLGVSHTDKNLSK